MRILAKREIDRFYDMEAGESVVVEEWDVVNRWNWGDDRQTTHRHERRTKLTRHELAYLHDKAMDGAA